MHYYKIQNTGNIQKKSSTHLTQVVIFRKFGNARCAFNEGDFGLELSGWMVCVSSQKLLVERTSCSGYLQNKSQNLPKSF